MRPEDPVGQRADDGSDRVADAEFGNADSIDFVARGVQYVPGHPQPFALLELHDDDAVGRAGGEGRKNRWMDGRVRPDPAAAGNSLPRERAMTCRAASARRKVPTAAAA